MIILGYSLIYIGLLFVAIGIYGVYRFDSFYARALVASKVDIVGEITILIGLICVNGFNTFSYKIILLLVILLIINPLNSHVLVRSAVKVNYKVRKE